VRGALLLVLASAQLGAVAEAHGTGAAITWNREISRIVYDKCASCHRPQGPAFSLMTFLDVQPLGTAIKDVVLSRQMPPWGAVKGFGQFRNDQALSQEQIELITKWVDGGIRRGNNPSMLPKVPDFKPAVPFAASSDSLRVSGRFTLLRAMIVDGLYPERVPSGQSMQVVAVMPGGHVEPLVWLHGYDARHPHPFLFRRSIHLPAGTVIHGVPSDAVIALIAAS
jgi:hypothetical protein